MSAFAWYALGIWTGAIVFVLGFRVSEWRRDHRERALVEAMRGDIERNITGEMTRLAARRKAHTQ